MAATSSPRPSSSASAAFETSAFSFKALAAALHPLMENDGGGLVGLDFDATVAWPAYDWMGVSKAALEAVGRYLARDLGPSNIRVNLVSAGPLDTPAAGGIPGFDQLAAAWGNQAPLGWDVKDPAPVADAVCFLMSDLARGITGEILHVDGGFHAIGAAVDPDAGRRPQTKSPRPQNGSARGRARRGRAAVLGARRGPRRPQDPASP